MKKILLAICIGSVLFANTQELAIIPAPAKMEIQQGSFVLSTSTKIIAPTEQDKIAANFLNDYLQKFYGFTLSFSNQTKKNCITLSTYSIGSASAEKYILSVLPNNISIVGNGHAGTFYGIQSLIQLLPIPSTLNPQSSTLNLPCLNIEDEPRFGYRGMHLDVSRHFFSVEYIKKYIDYIALHKMNTFHWHLTDDQGWRIEIKKYPKLTQVASSRNGTIIGRYPGKGNTNEAYGGFYTQAEIKEVVAYAAQRYITVIPEIEMPGHASAAIAAYPELSCFPNEATKFPPKTVWSGDSTQKNVQETWGVFEDVFCPTEYTFNFLQDVLDEVMVLFPSNYIHIGGDECPKNAWKKSAFCQQLIKEKKLKDEHELQSYFIQRMEKYVNSKGKKIIGWDEILEGGLAANATVMSWRGESGGIEAAKAKHNVIMTPAGWCYFDHSQTKNEDSVTIGNFLPLEKVYNYEPIPKELLIEEGKFILGAQGNLWTEYVSNPSKVEYMIFPRMSALSEVLWSSKEQRNWKSFEQRLPTQIKRYELWKSNYSNAYYDLQSEVAFSSGYDGTVQLSFKTNTPNAMISYVQSTDEKEKPYIQPIKIDRSQTVVAVYKKENSTTVASALKHNFSFNKATGRRITTSPGPSPTYAGNGGTFSLVNGLKSEKGFNSREWCGWMNQDVEVIIDLRQPTEINRIILNVLDQKNSWIYPPMVNEVAVGNDRNTFTPVDLRLKDVTDAEYIRTIPLYFDKLTTRYVRLKLSSFPKIPEGRPGAGKTAWFFIDEIEVH
jgi:hexosaminidase